MSSCLIALAGECQLERLEENFNLTIAVDGGFDLLERLNIIPSIFVGDCDSIEDASKIDSIKIKHILPTDKDVTDFDESLKVASELGCEFATVIGGLSGPRIDMVISNLEVASRYARQGFFIRFIEQNQQVFLVPEGSKITISGQGRISVQSLSNSSSVRIEGFRYSYEGELERTSSLGISNEFEKGPGRVTCLRGCLMVTCNLGATFSRS